MKIQICLIGGEVMPNVIGALQYKPDVIKAIATEQTERMAVSFGEALQSTGFHCRVETAVCPDGFDVGRLKQTVLRLEIPENAQIQVNWTGGTKAMSAVAREAALERQWPLVYVNTQQSEFLLEEAGMQRAEGFDLKALGITAMTQIISAGHRVENGITDSDTLRSCAKPSPELIHAALAIQKSRYSKALRRLAGQKPVGKGDLDPGLASILESAGLIVSNGADWIPGADHGVRPMPGESVEEAAAKFISSGWLEVFIYDTLSVLFSPDDINWHVTVNRGIRGRMSEFDILLHQDGRLLVVDTKVDTTAGQLSQQIMHTCSSTLRIGRLFSKWAIYIHRYADELIREPEDEAILRSQIERAQEFGGLLLFRDDLENAGGLYGRLAGHMGLKVV